MPSSRSSMPNAMYIIYMVRLAPNVRPNHTVLKVLKTTMMVMKTSVTVMMVMVVMIMTMTMTMIIVTVMIMVTTKMMSASVCFVDTLCSGQFWPCFSA